MATKDRKNVIFEEVFSEDKEVHDISDRISNLGRYQQYALEQTFGKETAPKKTFKDMVEFYRTLDMTFNLGLSNEVSELRRECISFEKQLKDTVGNVDDSYLIRSKIERFLAKAQGSEKGLTKADNNLVLFDAKYTNGDSIVVFDTIISSCGGVVFLEFLNPTRNIGIDESGNYMAFDYREVQLEKYNLLEKVQAKKELLYNIIGGHDIKEVPIFPTVVVLGKLAYANRCEELNIVRDSQLIQYLENICRDKVLDVSEQSTISKCLDDHRLTEKLIYSKPTGLVEAYADLRSKVEARILLASVDDEPADEEEGK